MSTVVALSIVFLILLFLTADVLVQRWRFAHATERSVPRLRAIHVPAAALAALPKGRFVAPGHTWVAIEENGAIVVGADALAASLFGEIDHVELVPPGSTVHRGDVVATLKQGERRIELRSALDGLIEAVNAGAERNPDELRLDPFGAGWLYRIQPRELAPRLQDMHIGDQAVAFMRRELGKLRDALARYAPGVAGATLADGGLLAHGAAVPVDDATFQRIAEELFHVTPGHVAG